MGEVGLIEWLGGRKRSRRGDGDGALDDLEDQAEWSSYTQDIPRLGDERRERIRLGRYSRGFRRGAARQLIVIVVVVAAIALIAVIGGVIFELIGD